MSFFAILREAFSTMHRTWQLVPMQLLFILATLGCFIFFIVIPVGIAFVFFGIDLTRLFDAREVSDVLTVFRETGGLLSRYLGVAIMVMFGLLLHLSSFVVLSVVNFGGTVGVLTQCILDRSVRFSFSEYVHEGKHLFGSMFIYSNLIGMLIFIPLFFMGIVRDGAAMLVDLARHQDAAFAFFLSIFFKLLLLGIAVFVFLVFGAMAVYGFAVIARHRAKPFAAVKTVFRYLASRPAAFGFFAIVSCGFFGALSVLFLLVYLFALIPLIGSLFSVLIYHAGMAYATVALFAAVCQYYLVTTENVSVQPSTPDSDTSLPQEAAPDQPQHDQVPQSPAE